MKKDREADGRTTPGIVADDRDGNHLGTTVDACTHSARSRSRPQGAAWSDAQIQEALEISAGTVGRVRKRCLQAGVQEAIVPISVQCIRRRLTGSQDAYMIALTLPPQMVTKEKRVRRYRNFPH